MPDIWKLASSRTKQNNIVVVQPLQLFQISRKPGKTHAFIDVVVFAPEISAKLRGMYSLLFVNMQTVHKHDKINIKQKKRE